MAYILRANYIRHLSFRYEAHRLCPRVWPRGFVLTSEGVYWVAQV